MRPELAIPTFTDHLCQAPKQPACIAAPYSPHYSSSCHNPSPPPSLRSEDLATSWRTVRCKLTIKGLNVTMPAFPNAFEVLLTIITEQASSISAVSAVSAASAASVAAIVSSSSAAAYAAVAAPQASITPAPGSTTTTENDGTLEVDYGQAPENPASSSSSASAVIANEKLASFTTTWYSVVTSACTRPPGVTTGVPGCDYGVHWLIEH